MPKLKKKKLLVIFEKSWSTQILDWTKHHNYKKCMYIIQICIIATHLISGYPNLESRKIRQVRHFECNCMIYICLRLMSSVSRTSYLKTVSKFYLSRNTSFLEQNSDINDKVITLFISKPGIGSTSGQVAPKW